MINNKKNLKAVHIGLSVGHAGSFDDSKPRLIHDFRRLEDVDVVAYCELYDSSYLDDAKKHHPNANLYSSVDDLIAKEDFDVACVVLLPRDVPDTLLKLANAGKHFLVDKQFARKSEELYEVVKVVERNRLTTFLGYPIRFHPAMQDLRHMIDEGVMGSPLFVEGRFVTGIVGGPHGANPRDVPYRMDTEGGGNLHYVGCHMLDGMRYLMGCEVKSIQVMNGRPIGHIEEPIEDLSIVALEYENGGYGSLVCGYMAAKVPGAGESQWDRGLVFRGTEGQANWMPLWSPKLELKSASEKWSGSPEKVVEYTLPPLPSIVGYLWFHDWIRRFIDDVRSGNKGVLTIDDGLRVLQSIDAAYESAKTGRRIAVEYVS